MDIDICGENVPVEGLETLKFKRLLNQGKFGKVYLAIEDVSHKMLAVKVVRCRTRYAESSMEREASIALLANHPAIITTFNMVRDEDGTFYLLQELATGGDLHHFLMNCGPCGAKSEMILKTILAQLASALTYLHNDLNVVYRDIKLENICIMQPSESYADWSIRLIDFGLASFMDSKKELTLVPGAVGTPMYIAPEAAALRCKGGHLLQPKKLDSFGVGVLIYALVTGSFPWDDTSENDDDYINFRDQLETGDVCATFGIAPWKLGFTSNLMQLIVGYLQPDPESRFEVLKGLEMFLDKPWFFPMLPLPCGPDGVSRTISHAESCPMLARSK